MAPPADTAPKAPAAFTSARLSPDEAERLAATFRPSWELDDAPFTGPGVLSDADLHALQGGGTHPDVRAVAHATNGTHAPAAPTAVSHEPENSVIIDRTITAQGMASPQPAQPASAPKMGAAKATMMGMAPPPAPAVGPPPEPVHRSQPPPAPPVTRRPPVPSPLGMPGPAAARGRAVSVDLDEGFPKKSKTGLWIGLGGVALLLIGVGVWAASAGNTDKPAPAIPTAEATTTDKASSIPPPPPPTTAATQAATPPAPPPATVAPPAPPTPVTALPPAAPPAPTHVAAAAPPPRSYTPPAAPPAKPPPRKGGATIVHDVPF